jgi:type IV secretory pathway TraG/TraD family ATPase VirD4
MAEVARWVDLQDVDDVATALMEIGNQQALDAWAACTSRPDNTMGSVYGTAETLLDVYGDPVVAASAEGCDLDIDELLTGANNTLYLYAPASEQERLRPLFELLVSVVIYKAEELAAAQPDGMLARGCSSVWMRRATARPSRSSPNSPRRAGARASSC